MVHRAHRLDAGDGQRTIERRERILPVIYTGDPFWNLAGRPVDDPHEMAWLEADDFRNLRRFIAGDRPTPGETVSVHYPSPQRVEIEARLEKPGLVILADVFYPGWKLQIDGREATLVRVNAMMRGAAVEAGFHRLVQTYEPASFRAGLAITCVTLALALAVGIWAWRNPAGVGLGRTLAVKPS